MSGLFRRNSSFQQPLARWLTCAALSLVPHSGSFAASAENGKAAFAKAGCWECHGTLGQGGVAGPRLAPDPMPVEVLIAFVRSSNRRMPAYSLQIVSDVELGDIRAYLSAIPSPPDYTKIPELQP